MNIRGSKLFSSMTKADFKSLSLSDHSDGMEKSKSLPSVTSKPNTLVANDHEDKSFRSTENDSLATNNNNTPSANDTTTTTTGKNKPEIASQQMPELVLPTGLIPYCINDWKTDDMIKIRSQYDDGLTFKSFQAGLQSFYNRDWVHAKRMFQSILVRFEDGPSRYYVNIIEDHDGVPPRDFTPYRKDS